MSGQQDFEYVAVRLEHLAWKDGEQQVTEQINRVALHGWRLVTVASDSRTTFAYFERRAGER